MQVMFVKYAFNSLNSNICKSEKKNIDFCKFYIYLKIRLF